MPRSHLQLVAMIFVTAVLTACQKKTGDQVLPCPVGVVGCPCDQHTCEQGAVCLNETCVLQEDAGPPPCPPGTGDCPCRPGETCNSGLACRDDICTHCEEILGNLYEEVEWSCDGFDNDCDGQTDEVGCHVWFRSFYDDFNIPWDTSSRIWCQTFAVGDSVVYTFLDRGIVAVNKAGNLLWVDYCDSGMPSENLDDMQYHSELGFGVVDSANNLYAFCHAAGGPQIRKYSPAGVVLWETSFDAYQDTAVLPSLSLVGPSLLAREQYQRNRFYLIRASDGSSITGEVRPDTVILRPVGDRSRGLFYLMAVNHWRIQSIYAVSAYTGEISWELDLSAENLVTRFNYSVFLTDDELRIFSGLNWVDTLITIDLDTVTYWTCPYEDFPVLMSGDGVSIVEHANPYPIMSEIWLCEASCGSGCVSQDYSLNSILSEYNDKMWTFMLEDDTAIVFSRPGILRCLLTPGGGCEHLYYEELSGVSGMTVGRDGVGYFCKGGYAHSDDNPGIYAFQISEGGIDEAGWGTLHHDERNTRSR